MMLEGALLARLGDEAMTNEEMRGDAGSGRETGRPFVLLVLPDRPETQPLVQMLAEEYVLTCCHNEADARACCARQSPALAIVQEADGHCDAFALLDQVQGMLEPGRPVLALLDACVPLAQEKALAHGARDIVCTDWSPRLILQRVRLLLGNAASGPAVQGDRLDMEWWRCCRSNQPLSLILLAVHGDVEAPAWEVEATLRGGLARPGDVLESVGPRSYRAILPETAYCGALGKAQSFADALEGRYGQHLGLEQSVVSCVPVRDTNCARMNEVARLGLEEARAARVSVVGQMC